MAPFLVNPITTRSIRDRAIAMLEKAVVADDLKLRHRAIRSLDEALRGPLPLFGMVVPEEAERDWQPEQLRILDILGSVSRQDDPLLCLEVWRAVKWESKHSHDERIREVAVQIIEGIPDSFDVHLARLMTANWDSFWEPDDDSKSAYEHHEKTMGEMRSATAQEFRERYPDATAAVDELRCWLDQIAASGKNPEPDLFFAALAQTDPEYALGIVRQLVHDPISALSPYVGVFLQAARGGYPDEARSIAEGLLAGGESVLRRGLAHSYMRGSWINDESDRATVQALLRDEDVSVRRVAVNDLRFAAREDGPRVIELAMHAEIGQYNVLADDLCDILSGGWGISIDDLSEAELGGFLTNLVGVRDIGDYHTVRFINAAASRMPGEVVELLFARLDAANTNGADYRPVPYRDLDLSGLVAKEDQRIDLLRRIRDRTLKGDSSECFFWLPKLFRDASSGFADDAVAVLLEWVESGERAKIEAVGDLMREAPTELIFERLDFVEAFLAAGAHLGDDALKQVRGDLWGVAFSGMSSGTPGQPRPKDVYIRDRGRQLATDATLSAEAREFFQRLAEGAEKSIRDDLARDEEGEVE